MAATGINEHYEACQKQNFMNQQAFRKLIFLDKYGSNRYDDNPDTIEGNLKFGTVQAEQNTVQQNSREKMYRQQEMAGSNPKFCKTKQHQFLTYSAKMKGRFTTINYCQQW